MGIYLKAKVSCTHCDNEFFSRIPEKKTLKCPKCKKETQRPEKPISGDWYIDYYHEGKRIVEVVGRNKKLAESALKKRQTQIVENRFFPDKIKEVKILFKDFAKEYSQWCETNNRSYNTKKFIINTLVVEFGEMNLSEITSWHIEKFKSKRLKGTLQGREGKAVQKPSVNREISCLSHIFTKAIEWSKARENPALKMKRFKEQGRTRFLMPDEYNLLIDKCNPRIKPIVIIAGYTGMRLGEVTGLKFENIDFNNNVIHLLIPKSGDKEIVYFDGLVKGILENLKKVNDSGFVFCHENGKPVKSIDKSFKRALKEAGITDFKFQDLRHTFASNLAMNGCDIFTLKELLRHKDIKMTLRYAHLCPNHKKKWVSKVGDVFGQRKETATNTATKTILPLQRKAITN